MWKKNNNNNWKICLIWKHLYLMVGNVWFVCCVLLFILSENNKHTKVWWSWFKNHNNKHFKSLCLFFPLCVYWRFIVESLQGTSLISITCSNCLFTQILLPLLISYFLSFIHILFHQTITSLCANRNALNIFIPFPSLQSKLYLLGQLISAIVYPLSIY